jgi:hypothetical protein
MEKPRAVSGPPSRVYAARALKKTDLGRAGIGAQFLSFYFPNR